MTLTEIIETWRIEAAKNRRDLAAEAAKIERDIANAVATHSSVAEHYWDKKHRLERRQAILDDMVEALTVMNKEISP